MIFRIWTGLYLGLVLNYACFGNIFSPDNRVPVSRDLSGLNTIGLIQQVTGKYDIVESCTGALIGKKVVLTAAHCVGRKGKFLSHRIRTLFSLPNRPKKETATYAVQGLLGEWLREEDSRKGDWAILLLNESPFKTSEPPPEYLPISTESPRLGDIVTAIGFSSDIAGNILSAHYNCEIRALMADGVFHHDCDVYAGASGGPLLKSYLTEKGPKWKIVGLHTAHKSQGTKGLRLPTYGSEFANLGTAVANFINPLHSVQSQYW